MTFAYPFWLLALLLIPAAVVTAIIASRVRAKRWDALSASRLRPNLVHRGAVWPRWISLVASLIAFAALVIALARPQFEGATKSTTIRGRNILIALDLSRSMQVADVKPDRLTQAKTLAYELLDALPNDRIGVVAFTNTAFLAAPFTIDHGAVRETIEQLDFNTFPTSGSDIEAALKQAMEAFRETGKGSHALIVLSDGEENEGKISSTLKDLDKEGVRVYAIGFGTEDGGIVPDHESRDGKYYDRRTGNPVLSRINHDSLRTLAKETGGRYLPATSATAIAETVRTAASDLAQQDVTKREERTMIELFPWFLGPALLLLLLSILAETRWRKMMPSATAALGGLLFLVPARGESQETPVANPYQEKVEKAWTKESRARWSLAEGAFDSAHGARKKATHSFSEGLMSKSPEVQANAHHNLGTNLFHSGWEILSDGQPYPQNEGANATFERLVKEKLPRAIDGRDLDKDEKKKWKEVPSIKQFDNILTDWTDAVRHYDSALQLEPNRPDTVKNRELSLYYLKRLREMLQKLDEQIQQQMPQQGQGGQRQRQRGEQPQEGDPSDEGEGSPGENPDGKSGQQGEEQQDGSQEQDENEKEGENGDKKEPSDQKGKEKDGKSPEEEARDKLKENADLEQGNIMGPQNRIKERPLKDW